MNEDKRPWPVYPFNMSAEEMDEALKAASRELRKLLLDPPDDNDPPHTTVEGMWNL